MVNGLQVVGGLALFLFGIQMLSNGMEKLAGHQLQQWLDRMTNRPIKAALFGFGATALIQSSSLLMLTMMGLLSANLMTLEQSVGVMIGQEIGTTFTGQIAAFDIGDFFYFFLALGIVFIEFMPEEKWRKYGEIAMGFGLLFLGMDLMSGALKVLATLPAVETWLTFMGQNVWAGVLAGTVITAIVQSSSAMTGLVVAMGMSQAITLPGAIALLLGANIGTCIDTQFVASFNLSRMAFRASLAQTFINVTGVLIFLPFLIPFAELVARTSPDLARQIANAHTIFNITVSVMLFPFVKYITRGVEALVPPSAAEQQPKLTAYIDLQQLSMPSVALAEAHKELLRIGETTAEMVKWSRAALVEDDAAATQRVLELEEGFIDPVCVVLEDFVNTLMRKDLSVEQQRRCFQIKSLTTDIERVGDLTENLAQFAQRKAQEEALFSKEAQEELQELFAHTQQTYGLALRAVQDDDAALAQKVCVLEDEFDRLYMTAREEHLERLNNGVCQPEASFSYNETLRTLERVCDHADNLALSVLARQPAPRGGQGPL
ncbi:MAG TPA: Na/Pi cotransporter family protein [Thermoflexia bacterium]|nr:Na/Pi cotransporter family protein [Thermoflexia bacterium]